MPPTRDTQPDAGPETLAEEGAQEAIQGPGKALARGASDPAAHHHTVVDPVVPTSGVERATHTTTSGTQISTIHPDLRRGPEVEHGAARDEPRSSARSSADPGRASADLRATDERFRAIEHHLARLDARMRLLEKGAPSQRASLLWWTLVLLIVAFWAWRWR